MAALAVAVGLVGGGLAAGRMLDDGGNQAAAPITTTVGSTIPRAQRSTTTTESGSTPTTQGSQTQSTVPAVDATLEPVVAAAKAAKPAVVQLETMTGLGSGFIFDDQGHILTAAHVVTGVTDVQVRLGDGSSHAGTVVGVNEDTDVAVVVITDPPDDLPVAALALDGPPEVGQQVIAIGSPFGLDQTVTAGIVSTVSRPVPVGNNVVGMVQTDAPINSGNSGGALVDLKGRVIGINDQIRTTSGDNAGIGFAIPIDLAYEVAQLLISGQPVQFGFLGVSSAAPSFGEAGALVTQVVAGSPAAQAGLREGDVITQVDGQAVRSYEELVTGIRARQPGTKLKITYTRGNKSVDADVTLGVAGNR